MSTIPLKRRPHGRYYQLRCRKCKRWLPASVIAGKLWIEDVMLDGAILPCACGRSVSWWYKLPASQNALTAARLSGAVDA